MGRDREMHTSHLHRAGWMIMSVVSTRGTNPNDSKHDSCSVTVIVPFRGALVHRGACVNAES